MFTTVLTSQGTITLPVSFRRKYGLSTGDTLIVADDGGIRITPAPTDFAATRARNKGSYKKISDYTQGDGFAAALVRQTAMQKAA